MEEFANLIFENWRKMNNYDINYFSSKGSEILDEAEKFLNLEIVDRFYELLTTNGEDIMRKAFISGFGYACKCLSCGRVELSPVNEIE